MSCEDERKILCVGLLCADLLVLVKEYPLEDTDSRTISQKWQRGGNASNNCTVLSYLGASCELLATLNDSSDFDEEAFLAKFLKSDLQLHGICIDNCIYHPTCGSPSSVVIINSQNGSRTILHQKRKLPELSIGDFKQLQLDNYRWIHFEGRSPAEYSKMLNHVNEWNTSRPLNKKITVSLEIEKPQLDYKEFSHLADILFVSKDLAMSLGHDCKEDAVKGFNTDLMPGAIVICPWGDDGVSACLGDGSLISIEAYSPPKIIDTLGAGDTFIAAVIFAMANGGDTKSSLSFGCRLAGEKCGMLGYGGLKNLAGKLYDDMIIRQVQC